MSTWLMLVVLYSGEIKQVEYTSKGACEFALQLVIDNGNYKHMSIAECVEEPNGTGEKR